METSALVFSMPDKSNRLLFLSALLNGCLAFVAGYTLLHSKSPQTTLSEPKVAEARITPACAPVVQAAPEATTWKAIASRDYPVYIDHLRALGCPERTIRSIIASEISLENPARTENGEPSMAATELTPDQQGLLQQLLGAPAGTNQIEPAAAGSSPVGAVNAAGVVSNQSTSTDASAAANDSGEEPSAPQMPLAFLVKPESGTELGAEEQVALQSLRKSFTDMLGGVGQNPADPAYLAKWVAAQPATDETFHTQFGDAAYGQMLLERANQSGNFQQ